MKERKLKKGMPEFNVVMLWWKMCEECGEFDKGDIGTDAEWDLIVEVFSQFAKCESIPSGFEPLARFLSMAWLNWMNYKHLKATGKGEYDSRYEYKLVRVEK